MAGLNYSALGNGGVGTTKVPDTVYVPAMVWVADDDTSTLDVVAVWTYAVDAISANAGIDKKNKQKIIRPIFSPQTKNRIGIKAVGGSKL